VSPPRLKVAVCVHFADDVRAALGDRFDDVVDVVAFEADCVGRQVDAEGLPCPGESSDQTHVELFGGACVADLTSREQQSDLCRLHCFGPAGYPLVNQAIAEQLIAEGAYLLSPGWARTWLPYLERQGFDRQSAREFFHEFCTQLVLLDTGTDPESPARLREMGDYLDLPVRSLACGLDYLRLFLTRLIMEWQVARAPGDLAPSTAESRLRAERAVTLDTLGRLAGITDEDAVAEQLMDLLTVLFSPGRIHLLTVDDSGTTRLRSRPDSGHPVPKVAAALTDLTDDYAVTDDGFIFRIGTGDAHAAVALSELKFAERRQDYINLSLSLAGAFDLALGNARSFARLERAQRDLRASEERYRALMDQAGDAIVLADARGVIIEANAAALRLLGGQRDDVVGRALDEVHGPVTRAGAREAFGTLMREGSTTIHGIHLHGPSGEDLVVDANFSLIEVGGRRIVQGIMRDVTERERTARRLRDLSLTDELTGLHNRRGFTLLAEQALKTAARRGGQPLLLLFADVDGLKKVNDTRGHAAGDDLIREAAAVLAGCFRDMDIIARLGGDEFAVLQIDAAPGTAKAIVARVHDAVAAANAASAHTWELSLSLGVAAFDPAAPCALDQLLHAADERMYATRRERMHAEEDGRPPGHGSGGLSR
jgi:diguanylate cyclase (GGDEF)-like protein/PAS domain S-box-containing protein